MLNFPWQQHAGVGKGGKGKGSIPAWAGQHPARALAQAVAAWGGHQVHKPWLKQEQPEYQQKPSFTKGVPKGTQKGAPPWMQKGSPHPSYGKGGGKGGKGKWQPQPNWQMPWQPQRKPPQSVPNNFRIDADAVYSGTCSFFHKFKGYGFIEMAETGVVPGNRIFFHWKQIQSDDRFPFLVKDVEVEFGLMIWKDHNFGNNTLRAKNVTLPGGMNVAMQDDIDAQQKEFVGGQHLRYTGTLKFYSPKHGFGYVNMDMGYDVDADVPQAMRVEREEVNAAGQPPPRMENVAVEFGIWKNKRGQYKVYNMTLPGGHPLTQDALENRISQGPSAFTGQVAIWNWRNGWGFIKPLPNEVMPARVLAKLAEQNAAAVKRGKRVSQEPMLYFRKFDMSPGINMRQGLEVTFQVYIDDKGAGASEVNAC